MTTHPHPVIRIAAAAAVMLGALGACRPPTPGPAGGAPVPYVSEDADGTAVIEHPITRKNHYLPGTTGQDLDRWEFCFDESSGGWTCVPVSAEDYQRYDVGDRVTLRQQVGQLAVITIH